MVTATDHFLTRSIRRVQPTRCNVSQFIYFCKTLYMFQTVLPSIMTSKLHKERQVFVRPLRSTNGLTNTCRSVCSFELMMDGKAV